MTMSSRLAAFRAANGDTAAQVALTEIMAARADGREPNVFAAHQRAGTLPRRLDNVHAIMPKPAPTPPRPHVSSAASTAPMPAPPPPRVPTAEERAQAARAARSKAVLSSAHAIDREVQANAYLGGSTLSAEQIISYLATEPTDAQRVAQIRRDKADAA